MKVAFIVNKFPCLSQSFILDQITSLIARGHEVDIYANELDSTSKIHIDVKKYHLLDKVYYLPSLHKNKILRFVKGLVLVFTRHYSKPQYLSKLFLERKQYGIQLLSMRWIYSTIPLIIDKEYDIIHCHFAPNGQKGIVFQDITDCNSAVVTTFHGYDVNRINLEQARSTYRQLFQRGNLYTVNSSFTKMKAVALGFPEDKIVKLPVGLNVSKYSFQAKKLAHGEIVKIITVARLVEKKGLEYSIKAVAKVLKSYPNIEYYIVGDGELRPKLLQLIKLLDLDEKVKLLGWMNEEEVRRLYQDAHIFILSSVTASDGDMEGQGLVLQEAQAMGLPVLSTLHNGIPDGVLDGKSGFLVPEKDVDALAERLQYLIDRPEIWAEMGKVGRDYVEQHYDINKLSDRLVKLYQKLLKQKQ